MALSVDLKGSCFCLITGASQGIGRALAIECAHQMGPNSVLLLVARNLDGLQVTKSLAESSNVKVIVQSVDLSDITTSGMEKMLNEALSDKDLNAFDLNMIIHNAGSTGDVSLSASQLDNVEQWRKYYDLNVFHIATLNCVFLKMFEKQEKHMMVVNLTSLCGIKPFAGLPLYCSGKAAREMYFKVLAEERPNIKVLNYSPGPVQTAMVQNIIDNTSDNITSVKEMFVTSKKEKKLLEPEQTAKKFLDILCKGNYKSGDHVDYFDEILPQYTKMVALVTKHDSFFLFIMGLAWRCRYSIPALLTCSLAVIGQACVFEVNIRTRHINNQPFEEETDDSGASDTSADSWETIYEEVSH